MKRLLLLPLSIALAGCPGPAAESPPAPAKSTPPTPAAKAAPSAGTLPATTMSPADVVGPITRYHWRLASATNAKGTRIDALFAQADLPVQLDFRHARLTVGNICNDLVGGYAQVGARLILAPLASTVKFCRDDELGKLDQEARVRLEGALLFSLDTGSKPGLTLTNAAGDSLVFIGEPIPEVRYDGPGKRLLLEVAAETKRCNHPIIPNKQCLQVREITHGDKGVKVGTPGKFLNFYGEIEGYIHQPGVSKVLRLHRYKIKNPPADGASTAYVLDTVVDSAKATR